jgi:asparagine synthase (glutamine-hydrolysing)
MCGISGFLAHDPAALAGAFAAVVRAMNHAIAHRGPDADRVWSHGPCALGHRRLSIIDLSNEANQPLLNEDETLAVIVNGEIYNFVELRESLRARGHTFRSKSDSEVALHLYEEHGEDFVRHLDGMFALALYDTRAQRLVLARDRSGKKPLYYRRTREGLAFASEVHALIRAFPDEPPEVDLAAIDEYLTLQYVPAPLTPYRDTAKLPAATVASITPGETPRPRVWWERPRDGVLRGTVAELAVELRALLARAVERRMVADVPLGAFLSGGVDSSAVVALMARASARPVKTFSIGFREDDEELGYARMVARRYGTDHRELIVSPAMTRVVGEIVRHHGEPFADSSSVATWYLAEMTREHVTVSLSGDASDENLAGYKRYNPARIGHLHDRLSPALRGMLRGALAHVGRRVHPPFGRFASALGESEAARYLRLVGQFTPEEKDALYAPALRDVNTHATRERFEHILAASAGTFPIARTLDLDFQTYLTDDINAKVDIASMAHALEVRCPFLDTAVVEFSARLPFHALMRVRGKHLLRMAMRELLPWQVLYRTKRGFALPLERWLADDLRAMTRDLLLDGTARSRGLFEPRAVEGLFTRFERDRKDADRIWTLLMLELWFREFIDAR